MDYFGAEISSLVFYYSMRFLLRLADERYSMMLRLISGEKQPQRLSKKSNIDLILHRSSV